jgi:hypothetical protein
LEEEGFTSYHAKVPYARDFRLICQRLATTLTWKTIAENVMSLPSFESLLRDFKHEKRYVVTVKNAESNYQLTTSDFSLYRLQPTKFKRKKCYYKTDLIRAAMIKFDHSFPKLLRHETVRNLLKEAREEKVKEREEKLEERERQIRRSEKSRKRLMLVLTYLLIQRRRHSEF